MPSTRDIALLKAFEACLTEGRLLDQSLDLILDAAHRFFDAHAVGLLPSGSPAPLTRAGASISATAAEQRLSRFLESALAEGREKRTTEAGLGLLAAPVKVADQMRGVFGVVMPLTEAKAPGTEESVRLFAQAVGRLLERERVVATLVKRREEAVALFELASGAIHSLDADEVIRLTASSLSRELEFDRVEAFRFEPETREIEPLLASRPGQGSLAEPEQAPRVLEPDELLSRALAAHGPVFDDRSDPDASGTTRRHRLAIPLEAGETVFGFLSMSRRGGFVLTPQEIRLVQELARVAAGALEKARLLESERRTAERAAFVARLHGALSGLVELEAILARTVKEVGSHFDLDLCAAQLLPAGEFPRVSAFHWKAGSAPSRTVEEIPRQVFSVLTADGSYILLRDVAVEAESLALVPAPDIVKSLPRPLSLLAVPIAYRGGIAGALLAVAGGRPRSFGPDLLRSFEEISVEVALAVASSRLLQKERDSFRFLDRLREVGRTLTTTFDAARIKHALCEQAVSLLHGESAQLWEADSQRKALRVLARWGSEPGTEAGRAISTEDGSHPVVKAFLEKTLVLVDETEMGRLLQLSSAGGTAGAGLRAAAVPLLYHDDQLGVLTLFFRKTSDAWPTELGGRLSLISDAGAVALRNAHLMRVIEQETERDSLTGLYNPSAVAKRLESEVRRAERGGHALSVAHLRVDGLTDSIERFGASFGDSILPRVASQLVRVTRSVNIVGRDRGDRFWILIFEATKPIAQRAVEAIQKNFAAAFDPRMERAAGHKFGLTVGIAVYPEDAFDAQSLLGRAEEALDDAIKLGPGSVAVYGAMSADPSSAP